MSEATDRVLAEVVSERKRQDRIWGEQNHEPCDYLAILVEEIGEVAKEAVGIRFGRPGRERVHHRRCLRAELVQVAAIAVAMIEALDRLDAKEDAAEASLETVEGEG